MSEVELKLYPNPTKNISILEAHGNYEMLELQIFTQSGEQVFSKIYNENLTMINLAFISSFEKGLYTVQVNLNKTYIREFELKKE